MAMIHRYEVDSFEDPELETQIYSLRDTATRSEARIAPALGCNLHSFVFPLEPGGRRPIEALVGPKPGGRMGFGFGNPILFPYPNRVRNGHFEFGGKSYQLDVRMGGHAIHGLVGNLPWKVDSTADRGAGARLTASLLSTDHSDVGRQFAFPFRITASFLLRGDTVRQEYQAQNLGTEPMPLGFGTHPYFRLPLVSSGRREDCLVTVPAAKQWELDPTLVPTGQTVPVPADKDFQTARPLGATLLDDVYTDVAKVEGWSECVLRDPAAGAEIVVRADGQFREWVVYAPGHLPAICFEPYTCTTDAFNLEPRGVDAGLIVLAPGETWRGEIWFTIRPTPIAS